MNNLKIETQRTETGKWVVISIMKAITNTEGEVIFKNEEFSRKYEFETKEDAENSAHAYLSNKGYKL